MAHQSQTVRMARGIAVALVAGTIAVAAPTASAASPTAKAGDSCKKSQAYAMQKVGNSYIRCEIVPGTSLHASTKDKQAKFRWTASTVGQWTLSSAQDATIRIDGSSTVAPLSTVAAKYFETATNSVHKGKGVKVAVGISGTGGGFEKFCKGETDISNASRKISSKEIAACAANGIQYTEVLIANDGLSVVVNPSLVKKGVKCVTMTELKAIWNDGSTITNWSQVRAGFPDQRMRLFGAGTDSGTFDAFTEMVNGRAKVARKDVDTSEDDNVTVRGVSSDNGGIGYFGLSYAIENAKKVTALQVDKGAGCVDPTKATVQNGTYALARPLFIYVKNSSVSTSEAVGAFVQFYVENLKQISEDAVFVPLTPKQRTQLASDMAKITKLPKPKKK